jgi:hypothetical protein
MLNRIKLLIPLEIKIKLKKILKLKEFKKTAFVSDLKRFENFDIVEIQRIAILSTRHAEFYAHSIQELLESHGFSPEVHIDKIENKLEYDLYFVLSPNGLQELPPAKKSISFQLEQLQSKRWMSLDYLEFLRESLAVVEYSKENIPILFENGIAYPKLFFCPIGISTSRISGQNLHNKSDGPYLFYGDLNQRRREILNEISKKYDVRIEQNLFGDSLIEAIRQSKAVINLHYYDNARLEFMRINQSLSYGKCIISETTKYVEKDEYIPGVYFFREGNVIELLNIIDEFEKKSSSTNQLIVVEGAQKQRALFQNYFERLLIGIGLIRVSESVRPKFPLSENLDRICLAMPETPDRMSQETKELSSTVSVFPGVRHPTPWIGCALSYRSMAEYALTKEIKQLEIFEDDVLLDENFHSWRNSTLLPFLAKVKDWDIYCGLIAHFDEETKVLEEETFNGTQFVTVNQMTSMVYNIYNERALLHIAKWKMGEGVIHKDSIDRYINSLQDLRIIITLPFKVHHDTKPNSTLWQFSNSEYDSVIKNSEKTIRKKLLRFIDDNAESF